MDKKNHKLFSHVALTGGIGSGKSYICRYLKQRGITVYDCDEAAKRLMRTSQDIREALLSLVGESVYDGLMLQKGVLAKFILTSEANKQAVNNIVHPAVAVDYLESGLEWLESAILFESHFDARVHFDYIVCVTAPIEVRVKRIMQRDSITREQAMQWIQKQMPQEEIARRSDGVIVNDGIEAVDCQIDRFFNIVSSENSAR